MKKNFFFRFFILGLVHTLDINILIVWIILTINSLVGLYVWFYRWKNPNKTPNNVFKLLIFTC
jgi:hypothetical protein